jgi:tetratricopeptide (TPR) repeat protein
MSDPSNLLPRLAEDAFRAGRPDVAAHLLRQATRDRPAQPNENPDHLHAEAIRLLNANQLNEAEPLLQRAIRLKPTVAAWYEHLGVLYAQQRRFAEAVVTIRVALRLDAAPAGRWHNLALAYIDLNNPAAAEQALSEAIRREPGSAHLRIARANVLNTLQKFDDAITEARGVTERFPENATGWTALGLLLAGQEKFDEAVPVFERAAALAPDVAEAHSNLAAALGKLKRWEESERASRAALAFKPNHATAWGNLGNCLRDLGRYEEAETALRRCLELTPNDADAASNLALTLSTVGRHADALHWFDRSLALKPDHDETRFNRSLTYLTLGDFTRGWPDYEYRWKTVNLKNKQRTFPQPRWVGGDLRGKTIFLAAEQGLGDYIQFIRFARPLAELGAKVIVQPPTELIGLVRTVPGVSTVIDQVTAEATFHTHCSIMSVPGHLKYGLTELSGEPYMTATPEAVAKWREKLAGVPGFKVGFTWQGNPQHTGDRWRSVKLERFAPLAAIPGVTIVSVQKGYGREQLESATFPIHDVGQELTDFTDTAGLLMNLDLLISIDSAVVHLAGALGVRVWNAISFNNDWRWMRDRTDTPWYRSMTLFRQPKVQDWDSVFMALQRELQKAVE